ncbi:hypothetical protein GGF31_001273 [Allomyces arbusculus]|nr:hypothetical protein GGF31_001273 [Allomyces arbusculus]
MSDVPVYGIDREIKEKLEGKLSADQVFEVQQWMEAVLGCALPDGGLTQANLKDGAILVELLNKATGSNVKVNKSALAFKQMENIHQFLVGAERLGCPKFELFQTIDLFEDKNFPQVVQALYSFARHAHKAGHAVPVLGPKLHDSRAVQFTEEQLNAGRNMPTLQSGALTANTGPSALMSVGMPRQITDTRIGHAADVVTLQSGGLVLNPGPSALMSVGMPRQITDARIGQSVAADVVTLQSGGLVVHNPSGSSPLMSVGMPRQIVDSRLAKTGLPDVPAQLTSGHMTK